MEAPDWTAGVRAEGPAAGLRGLKAPLFRGRAWAPVPGRAARETDAAGAPLWEPLDFDFFPGDRILLDGPSGCGKSTFLLALAGLLEGQRAWSETGSLERPAVRGGFLFQNPADRFCAVYAADELAFGLENQGLPLPEIERRMAATSREFGLEGLLDRRVDRLSGGEQQRLALASLWAEDPEVLFVDEAMSQLDGAGRRVLLAAYDRWDAAHPAGIAVVVDHRAELWEGRLGRAGSSGRVFSWTGAGWRETPLADERSPAGPSPTESRPQRPPKPPRPLPVSPPAAACRALHLALPDGRPLGGGHDPIDVAFHGGRVAVIAGPNGAGKSTLLKTLAGLASAYSGEISHGDRVLRKAPKRKAEWRELGKLVSLALQNPELQFGAGLVRDHDPEPPDFLGLAQGLDKSPFELSLGQQRRLSLSMLRPERPLLLLDEPFYGQDRGNTRVLFDYIRSRAEAGTAVVAVCHDEDLSQALADDLYIWNGKRLSAGERKPYRPWWEEDR